MGKKNLISITDFSQEEILKIMELATRFEADPHRQVLAGKVIASLFFEPSTRTRLSFESAINTSGAGHRIFRDRQHERIERRDLP